MRKDRSSHIHAALRHTPCRFALIRKTAHLTRLIHTRDSRIADTINESLGLARWAHIGAEDVGE
jgi:hypothetical protein